MAELWSLVPDAKDGQNAGNCGRATPCPDLHGQSFRGIASSASV